MWVHVFVQAIDLQQNEYRKLIPPYLLVHLLMDGQPYLTFNRYQKLLKSYLKVSHMLAENA